MKIRRPVFRSSIALLTLMPAAAMAQLPGADELNSPPPVEQTAAPVEQPAVVETAPVTEASVEAEPVAPESTGVSRDERFVSASLNVEGGVGLQHLEAAYGGVPGTYRIGLLGEFFSGSDVIRYNDENTYFGGNLLFEATPLDFLSVHARIQTRNNVNSFGRPEAMLSQGDFSLGAKGFYAVSPGVTLGGDLGFFVPTDFGSTGLTFDGLSVRPRFLASLDFAEMLQSDVFLKTHFNLGYRVDRSENTVPDGVVPTRVERFAYGLSAYDAVEMGLGLEYDFPYVAPFLEWNLAIPVNGADGVCDQANLPCAGDAGFASFPNVLSLGLRAEPVENLGLHAGVDFGLTSEDAAGLPVTAPWQLVFGLQWTIDPRPKIEYVEKEAEKVETAMAEAFVLGVVTDRETALPVEGATVRYPMGNETAQLTDATGTFRSYGYAPGSTVRFAISHPDYEAVDVDRVLPGEAGDHELRVQLKAMPRTGDIQGGVTDEKGNPIPGATISISGTESKTLSPDLSGRFKLALRAGEYSVAVSAPGYLTRGRDIKVEATKTLDLEFMLKDEPKESLVSLKADKIEILQTVYFETGKATILPKSFPLLEQVSSVMSANPQIKRVVIGGHTDDVGADEFNLELSQKRAEAVRQFLIDQGVGADRLVAKGFGETQPLLPNTSTRNRGVNRRVEFKITDR
jgi:outer membrane protein OmpA-like peptidoglycan-associated protein